MRMGNRRHFIYKRKKEQKVTYKVTIYKVSTLLSKPLALKLHNNVTGATYQAQGTHCIVCYNSLNQSHA